MADSALIPIEKAYETLTTPAKRRRRDHQAPHVRSQGDSSCPQPGQGCLLRDGTRRGRRPLRLLSGQAESLETALGGFRPLAETGNYPGQEEIADGLGIIRPLLACDESYKFIERFNDRKDDLLGLCDDFHDLENFYEYQKPTWERLRKASERFRPQQAGIGAGRPGSPGSRADAGNPGSPESLWANQGSRWPDRQGRSRQRSPGLPAAGTEALAKIDEQIAEVSRRLQPYRRCRAEGGMSPAFGDPTGRLKRRRARPYRPGGSGSPSAGGCCPDQIKAAEAAAAAKPMATTPTTLPPAPPVKPRRIVKPAELVASPYLETIEDVNVFLDQLRRQLEAAIASGQRIQIR